MSENERGFWRDPNRSVLGLCYMAGSVLAFAAGTLTDTAELLAMLGWVVVTIGFYWIVHAVLQGRFFSLDG